MQGVIKDIGVRVCVSVLIWVVCVHTTLHSALGHCNNCWVYIHYRRDQKKMTHLLPLSASRLAHTTPSLFAVGSQLQPLPSYWPSRGCCLVTSEARIFEQSSGFLLQHFYRQSAEWDDLAHSHRHTFKNTLSHIVQEDTKGCTLVIFLLCCSTCWCWHWHLKVLNLDNQATWYEADLQTRQKLKEQRCEGELTTQNKLNGKKLLQQEMCQEVNRHQREKRNCVKSGEKSSSWLSWT